MASVLKERRRALMGQKKSVPILPPEYQQVAYITANGSAYCGTNAIFSGRGDTITSVVMQTVRDTATNRNATGGGTLNYYVGFANFYSDGTIGGSFGTTRIKHDFGDVTGKKVAIAYGMESASFAVTATVDGVTKTDSASKGSEVSVSPIRIGFIGLVNQAFTGRIYRYYCTDSGGNKRWDFYPCYRKADGVVGMYDIINNLFVSSDTSTPFGKGGNV